MKVLLLNKMVGVNGFFPAGSVVDVSESHAMILVANRHACLIGPDGKPVSPPAVGVKIEVKP